MWDVNSIGEEKYVAAKPLKNLTTLDNIKFISEVFLDVLRTLLFTFLTLIDNLKCMFVKTPVKNVEGKLALISGGANGLGKEIAIRLGKEKCNIAIVDLDLEGAKKTVEELRQSFGIKAEAYKADVSDYEAIAKLKLDINRDLGTVSILVNNAGLIPYVSLREKHWTDVEKILKINIHSHFWTSRIFLEDMIKQKDGHIVAISSLAGIFSGPYMITYSATKHALNGMMSSLADELIFEGHGDYIKTTCICPYFINTRKEVMDFINLRFPPLNPDWTADKIVKAILENQEYAIISKLPFVIKSCQLLPKTVQRICSEYIFNVREARNLDMLKNH